MGPRQSGKTTWPAPWTGAIPIRSTSPTVCGWPSLFPRLRGSIDRDRKRCGRFLLLGSVSPSLMTKVSESLAGRLSVLELTPLLKAELIDDAQRKRHWLVGGYSDGGVLNPAGFPQWQSDYLTLLSPRDLPNWGLPARARTTLRPLRIAGGSAWPGVESQPDRKEHGAFLSHDQSLHGLSGRRVLDPQAAPIPCQHSQAAGQTAEGVLAR